MLNRSIGILKIVIPVFMLLTAFALLAPNAFAADIVVTTEPQLADCVGDPQGAGAFPTAAPGDTCLVQPPADGEYNAAAGYGSTLEIRVQNIRVIGVQGSGATVIEGDGTGNGLDCVDIEAPGVTFQGFTIRDCGATDEGIEVEGNNGATERIVIRDIFVDGDFGADVDDGIAFRGAADYENILIEDVFIENVTGDGIDLDGGGPTRTFENLTLAGVQVIGAGGDGFEADNNAALENLIVKTSSECKFNNNTSDGIEIENVGNVERLTIDGCEASTNGDDGFEIDNTGSADNWTIRNTRALNNADEGWEVYLNGDLSNTNWTGNVARNNSGVTSDGWDIDLDAGGEVNGFAFHNNQAQDNGDDGLELGTDGGDVKNVNNDGNVLVSNGGDNIYIDTDGGDVENININGDDLRSAGEDGIDIEADGGNVRGVRITNNNIPDSGDEGIELTQAGGSDVEEVFIDGNTIEGSGDENVHIATVGGDIRNVQIGNGNNLRDASSEGIEIQVGGSGDVFDIQILGNNLDNNGTVNDDHEGIIVSSDEGDVRNVTVQRNNVNNSAFHNIRIQAGEDLNINGTTGGDVDNVNVSENNADSAGEGSVADPQDGSGIFIDAVDGSTRNVTVANNDPSGNSGHGIGVGSDEQTANVTIEGNTTNNNDSDGNGLGAGIQTQAGENLTQITIRNNESNDNAQGIQVNSGENAQTISVTDNRANNNSVAGVDVFVGDNLNGLDITDNELLGNGTAINLALGVSGTSTNVNVSGNTMQGASGVGIRLDTQNTTIQCNSLTGFDTAILAQEHNGNAVNFNDIFRNDLWGLDASGVAFGATLNAENNFWGDAAGPRTTSSSPGFGDKIRDPNKVDFAPFKTDSALDESPCVTAPPGPTTATLTVTGAGTGSGTVTGTGINCTITAGAASGDCSETVAVGTSVTLTATAAPGFAFVNFSGGGCSSSPCTTTVNANTTVTATFGLPPLPPDIVVFRNAVERCITTPTRTIGIHVLLLQNQRGGPTGDLTITGVAAAPGSDWTAISFTSGVGRTLRDGGIASVIARGTCTGNNLDLNVTFSNGSVLTANLAQAPQTQPLAVQLNGSLLTVRAQDAVQMSAQIFSLSGQKVLTAQAFGGRLTVLATDAQGRPLANGVYFLVVTVEKADGTVTRELKKIAVMR